MSPGERVWCQVPMSEQKNCLANKVVIRVATREDLPLLTALVAKYYLDHSGESLVDQNILMNADIMKQSAQAMVNVQGVLIGEIDGHPMGVIAGNVFSCLFTRDVFFSVMFLYVLKEFRQRTKDFIKEVELCLLPSPVTKITLAIPAFRNAKKLVRFLRMNGYRHLETHFYKEVGCG